MFLFDTLHKIFISGSFDGSILAQREVKYDEQFIEDIIRQQDDYFDTLNIKPGLLV